MLLCNVILLIVEDLPQINKLNNTPRFFFHFDPHFCADYFIRGALNIFLIILFAYRTLRAGIRFFTRAVT